MNTHAEPYLSFDRVAGCYESTRFIPPAVLRAAARLLIQDGLGGTGFPVLDAGVGTGRFARYLAAQGLRVVGVDVSGEMLRRARASTLPVSLVRADLRALPFCGEVFAGGLMVHVLHLIADWQRVIEEVRRVLRPGAPLYLGSETGRNLRSRSLYFQVAGERGLTRANLGAQSFDVILQYLTQESGGHVTQIDESSLRWTARVRVQEMLDTLRQNPFSHLWHIPAGVHADLMTEVEQRARAAFPSLDAIEEAAASLSLWRVTWR